MEILTHWPFSQGEMHSVREGFIDTLFLKQPVWTSGKSRGMGRDELMEKVQVGGYPVVVARSAGARRKAWFQSYLTTILQRDVRDLASVADVTALPRLLSVVAARCGGLLNFADLSRTLALSPNNIETLLCPAGSDSLGAAFATLVEQFGPATHSNAESLFG